MAGFHPTDEQIDTWANMMLEETADEMVAKEIEITPESLSTYFEETRGFTFTPSDAKLWLEEQKWWLTYTQERKEYTQ